MTKTNEMCVECSEPAVFNGLCHFCIEDIEHKRIEKEASKRQTNWGPDDWD